MKVAPVRRRVQIFVCTNRREGTDPLGAGCGDRGETVHDGLRAEIARRGAWRNTWLARTGCLGVCPAHGCTVVVAPSGSVIQDVEPEDVDALLDAALGNR